MPRVSAFQRLHLGARHPGPFGHLRKDIAGKKLNFIPFFPKKISFLLEGGTR
jgi:hypothetical protein